MILQDLTVGNIYFCNLANVPVLITQRIEPIKSNPNSVLQVKGLYFNSITGRYETINIYNEQLK